MENIVERLRDRVSFATVAQNEAKSAASIAETANNTVVRIYTEASGDEGVVFLYLENLSGETLRLLATEQSIKDAAGSLLAQA